MTKIFATAIASAVLFLSGCAAPPQQPVGLSKDLMTSKPSIGVGMTSLPTVDTQFPGAGCLLCLAAASIANRSLTTHVQTLPSDDAATLKDSVAKLLMAKGMNARVIDEPLKLKDLPNANGSGVNQARQDFKGLKAKYNVDKLLVIDITAMGVWRNFSGYIPTGDPKAIIKGSGYIVNLDNNALDWYVPLDIQKSAEQTWDEPPKFPGLTNAYFQALEAGKDALTKPFEQ